MWPVLRLYFVYYAYTIVYFFKPWYYFSHLLPSLYLFIVCLIRLSINVVFLPRRFVVIKVDNFKTKLATDESSSFKTWFIFPSVRSWIWVIIRSQDEWFLWTYRSYFYRFYEGTKELSRKLIIVIYLVEDRSQLKTAGVRTLFFVE